jgi:precorrin-6B methylase 2
MQKPEFVYADGGEQRLLELFAAGNELRLAKERQAPSSWALHYHLSAGRANVLKFLKLEQKDSIEILELGAGCGAVTEYLVGLGPRVTVTAIEGAKARAEVIKLRCKDAPNLKVVNTNICDYAQSATYDLVLVIGVLEYSGKYVSGGDPYASFLKHAASFLKPHGRLVVAIENQVGHKYLAGYAEDHYAMPFEGVGNYPHYYGVRTFTKFDLARLLESAGLPRQEWFYPFPDYKIPDVVLTDAALKTPGFDWCSLMEFPTKDLNWSGKPCFSEKEFMSAISKNVDPSVFMNSFIVVASANEMESTNLLAFKSNHERSAQFETTKWFEKGATGQIQVRTVNTASGRASSEGYLLNHKNLHSDLVDVLYRGDRDAASALLLAWEKELIALKVTDQTAAHKRFNEFSLREFGRVMFLDEKLWLLSNTVDLTPRNVLVDAQDGSSKVIDLEWSLPCEVPFGFVVCRGLWNVHRQLKSLSGGTGGDVTTFIRDWGEGGSQAELLPSGMQSCMRFAADSMELNVWLVLLSRGWANTCETRTAFLESLGVETGKDKAQEIAALAVDRSMRYIKPALRRLGLLRIAQRIAQRLIE